MVVYKHIVVSPKVSKQVGSIIPWQIVGHAFFLFWGWVSLLLACLLNTYLALNPKPSSWTRVFKLLIFMLVGWWELLWFFEKFQQPITGRSFDFDNVKEPEPKVLRFWRFCKKSTSGISLDSKSLKNPKPEVQLLNKVQEEPPNMNVFGGHLTSRNVRAIKERGYYTYSLRVQGIIGMCIHMFRVKK